ncbi:MAG: type II secretion system F family protein [Actinomycetota bacterium]
MRLLVTAAGALGLLLLVSGLPVARRSRLAARVDPYVVGLYGRPSRLLSVPTTRGSITAWFQRVLPGSARSNERLAERLSAADLAWGPAEFRLRQMLWGATAAVGSWTLLGIAAAKGTSVNLVALPALGLAAFALGFSGRDWGLTRQIEERRALLQEELPTAIDLVTLSIMAGESVPAAFARVADVMPSAIGSEFSRVLSDVRAGEPIVDALETLKSRVPNYGVARFVDALCTGIERGAPLADVLRAQADDVRESHRRRLIELGGRREVLMLVPVVFLIMPVVVVFALLPGLVSLNLIVP